ncbi:MAG TPA: exonuclease, partial [Methanoregulaceae archaeon]|nr:exonuclease [Methanoregulaceae archaeon]
MSEPFGKVAARLAGTIDRQREYTVIRNDNIFRSGFIDRHIFSSDYQRATELLRHLLDLHQGAGLGEVFGGQA